MGRYNRRHGQQCNLLPQLACAVGCRTTAYLHKRNALLIRVISPPAHLRLTNGDISMRLICFYLLLLVSIYFQSADGVAWAKSPYRMEGVVTDSDTQEPVANTTVQVLITSESDPSKKIRKAVTDDDGRYAVELPAGHGWAWYLVLPDGYCPWKVTRQKCSRQPTITRSLRRTTRYERIPDQGRRSAIPTR